MTSTIHRRPTSYGAARAATSRPAEQLTRGQIAVGVVFLLVAALAPAPVEWLF